MPSPFDDDKLKKQTLRMENKQNRVVVVDRVSELVVDKKAPLEGDSSMATSNTKSDSKIFGRIPTLTPVKADKKMSQNTTSYFWE